MSSKPPKATAPPPLGQLLKQSAEASVGTFPTILRGFQEFGPQFAETESAIREQLFPLIQGTRRGVSGLLGQRLEQSAAGEIPEFLKRSFQGAVREGQSIRGIARSPISAVQEGIGLAGLAEESARFNIQEGTRFAGTPAPSIAGTAAGASLLAPPGIQQGAELERQLITDRDTAALQNFQLKQKQKQALARTIGTGIGLAASPFIPGAGLATTAFATKTGAEVGAGFGTFF